MPDLGPISERLERLQQVLDSQIPMCAQMGIRIAGLEANGQGGQELRLTMPLDGNHNHQQTAFAGSLNALCTITGWSMTYLELESLGSRLPIVIRRSSIKYHRPVDSTMVQTSCAVPTPEARQYFCEMLQEKGQAKLDLTVQIASFVENDDRPAVAFSGSYVAVSEDAQPPGYL